METVLENYLEDFCENYNFRTEDISRKFENFANYIAIPKIEDSHEAIENAGIGYKGNPGIILSPDIRTRIL